jgi:hypothetical protein
MSLTAEARPNRCNRPMRDGACQMRPAHRGRHSTVTFDCDGCGATRRGQGRKYDVIVGGEVDDQFEFCFMCESVPSPPPRDDFDRRWR